MALTSPFSLALIVTLTLICEPAAAFYPNLASLGLNRARYTDESVTEAGILRAVGRFLEGRAGLSPGTLENLSPLTPATLYVEYYQANVSAVRFIKALQEVVEGNNFMEAKYNNFTQFFAYCEQLSNTRGELVQFRMKARNEVKSGRIDVARRSLGQALHILNKFYSNTNWIEQGNVAPLEALVNRSLAFPAIANSNVSTCNDCTTTSDRSVFECLNNMAPATPLTSGYKLSKSCTSKPLGKCSHGGLSDTWQSLSATGGINKETLEPGLSPHHDLHEAAGELAVIATRDLLVGSVGSLLDELGDELFIKLFNLERHPLVYVVDVTGSMSDDIVAVRDYTKTMLLKVANETDAPESYILVTFSDPEVYEPLVTKDWREMYDALDNLVVDGGGDCPEMSLSALEVALNISEAGSNIYLFTDAGAKDEDKMDVVTALFESTDSRLTVFHTGDYCRTRSQRDVSPRARAAPPNVYEILATLSGGQYILTTKGNLPSVLGIMELSLNSAPVTVLHAEVAPPGSVSFHVDPSMSEIAVSVSGAAGFGVELLQPSGDPATNVEDLVTAQENIVRRVTSVSPGSWEVRVSGPPGPRLVQVTGHSLFDFSTQLLQEQNGFQLPILGRPVTGELYLLWVKPLGSLPGFSMSRVRLLTASGDVFAEHSVSATESEFGVPLKFDQPTAFMVEVCGDGHGSAFCRLHPRLTAVESFQLVLLNVEDATLKPGVPAVLLVSLENRGVAQSSFSVSSSDEAAWSDLVTHPNIELGPGESFKIALNVTAPEDAVDFAGSMLRVTADSLDSPDSSYSLGIPLSVAMAAAEAPDLDPPAIVELARYLAACTAEVQHGGAAVCSAQRWSVDVGASDLGPATAGSLSVVVAVGDTVGELDVGESSGRYTIRYSSPCCSPWVTLDVSDFAGNMQRYSLNFAEPAPAVATTDERQAFVIALSVVSAVLLITLVALGGVVGRYCCRSRRGEQRGAPPSVTTNPWTVPMERPQY